jgi:hypothetical protein
MVTLHGIVICHSFSLFVYLPLGLQSAREFFAISISFIFVYAVVVGVILIYSVLHSCE